MSEPIAQPVGAEVDVRWTDDLPVLPEDEWRRLSGADRVASGGWTAPLAEAIIQASPSADRQRYGLARVGGRVAGLMILHLRTVAHDVITGGRPFCMATLSDVGGYLMPALLVDPDLTDVLAREGMLRSAAADARALGARALYVAVVSGSDIALVAAIRRVGMSLRDGGLIAHVPLRTSAGPWPAGLRSSYQRGLSGNRRVFDQAGMRLVEGLGDTSPAVLHRMYRAVAEPYEESEGDGIVTRLEPVFFDRIPQHPGFRMLRVEDGEGALLAYSISVSHGDRVQSLVLGMDFARLGGRGKLSVAAYMTLHAHLLRTAAEAGSTWITLGNGGEEGKARLGAVFEATPYAELALDGESREIMERGAATTHYGVSPPSCRAWREDVEPSVLRSAGRRGVSAQRIDNADPSRLGTKAGPDESLDGEMRGRICTPADAQPLAEMAARALATDTFYSRLFALDATSMRAYWDTWLGLALEDPTALVAGIFDGDRPVACMAVTFPGFPHADSIERGQALFEARLTATSIDHLDRFYAWHGEAMQPPLSEAAETAEIAWLFVDPDVRGQAMVERVYATLLGHAPPTSIRQLIGLVNARATTLTSAYRRWGCRVEPLPSFADLELVRVVLPLPVLWGAGPPDPRGPAPTTGA